MEHYPLQLERLVDVGRLDDASELVERWIASEPQSPRAHYYRARIALARQDYAGSISAARQALANAPHDRRARHILYLGHFGAHEYPAAESVILELIRENPSHAQFIAHYARLMLCTLHLDKSKALVAEALRLAPDNTEARLVSALLRVTENRAADAARELASVIREDPDAKRSSLHLLEVLLAQRRLRSALALSQELLRDSPSDPALEKIVIDLRVCTHWCAMPAYPVLRWGWAGVAALWIVGVLGVLALSRVAPAVATALGLAYLVWVLHSWTFQPILRRWIRWRGI